MNNSRLTSRRRYLLIFLFILFIIGIVMNILLQGVFSTVMSRSGKPDLQHVKSSRWYYVTGFKINEADLIAFDSTNYFELKSDTICVLGIPKATILSAHRNVFELQIASLENDEPGTYRNTEERLK